jgi:hypothetical protein
MTPPVPRFDVIIDGSQAQFTGTWQTPGFSRNSYNQNCRITDRAGFSAAPRVALWRPALPSYGDYTVAIWLPDGGRDRSPAVKYRLHHAGQVSEFLVDQTTPGGRWRQLGRGPFHFDGSGKEFLELRVADVGTSLQNTALYVQADAVRFASPPPPLTVAPRILSTIEASNHVEITWQPIAGSNMFVVSRGLGEDSPTEVAELAGTTYLDLDVDRGSRYTYAVTGVNGAGVGPSTSVTAAPSKGVPLQAVQGLQVRTVGGVPVLSWQPTRDATGYLVQRSDTSGGPFTTVGRVDGTQFVDFLSSREAHYVVRSVNAEGECALTSWQVNWQR